MIFGSVFIWKIVEDIAMIFPKKCVSSTQDWEIIIFGKTVGVF